MRLLMLALLSALAAGCGSAGRAPILGLDGIVGHAPTVSAVTPVDLATGVSINTATVTAAFSEAMAPITGGASFTLTCAPPCVNPTGTIALDAAHQVAVLTLAGSAPLTPFTQYTATITGARSLATGIALASPYRWQFTTGVGSDLQRPTVSSTGPAAGATAVAVNTLITASFSEPMDPLSISTGSFSLACPAGAAIAGAVGYAVNGNVATFTPANTLPANSNCTATISTAVLDAAHNAMVAAFSWSFMTGVAPDTTAPTVSSTSPAAGATAVAINTLITASFSEPMDPLSMSTANLTLACPAGAPVMGIVGYAVNGNVATFTPASSLPANTTCTATISTGVRDAAHNAMVAAFTWSFMTGVAPDTTAPTVSSTGPAAGASAVAINTLITASFSEPMDPLSIGTGSFSLACPAGAPVMGTVGYAVNGNVATFTPASSLPASTTCTATISTAVQDVAHNAMSAAFAWSFMTGVAPDTTAPTVSSTSPAASATAVAINTLITASFSEPMDPLSISTGSLSLACPAGAPIAGTVGYAVNGNVATFTPANTLPASATCTATIGTGVQDAAHNHLAAAFTWSFKTGVAPDTTAPTVSSTGPAAGASAVAINTLITANFSEPMDPLSISTATLVLACPAGVPVAGTVGYAVNGNVATFTPASTLPASTTCTATISTGVQDVADNPMAAAFMWSFVTGVAPDTTAPMVSSTSPAAGASTVAINSLITASFSEPMDPLTISTANFALTCPAGAPIAGTVGYAVTGNVATFTPVSNLPASSNCTATISTGVQDVAHNAMAATFIWSFATGVAPDTTAPTVSSTNPAGGDIGICVNKAVNVTFSEPMDPLTITTTTFRLAVTAGASVTGVVSYDASTHIATFTPAARLIGTPATNYTATIKGGLSGVKDLAGNALATDQTITLTTNSSTCTTAPSLGAAASFGAFGGSATLTNDGLATVINGDIGVYAASTKITGLHDSAGNVYTVTPNNNGAVNGLIYTLTAPPGSVGGVAAMQAQAAALGAFNSISPGSLAGGIDVSSLAQCPTCGGVGGGVDELAGRILPPGIYLSATGTYDIGGAGRTQAGLILDAGGDANAVWVFQTAAGAGTLNVGLTGPATPAVPIQILLMNGAQAKNVFWYVPAGATIGTGSTIAGTLLANASITFSTTGGSPPTAPVTTVNGRALALTAAVTMTNTVINVPPP